MRYLFACLFLIISLKVNSQNRRSVAGNIGIAPYMGDVCKGFCMKFSPAIGGAYIYQLHRIIFIKAELNYYRFSVKDDFPSRNLSFRSNNVETYGAFLFDFLHGEGVERRRLSPFGFIGIGITYFNPQGQTMDGKWHSLRQYKTEGIAYGPVAPFFTVGFGSSLKLKENLSLVFEIGYRTTRTDYLDDVSSFFWKDPAQFSDPVARELATRYVTGKEAYRPNNGDGSGGSQRGNPDKKDKYLLLNFKLRYYLK